MMDGLLMPLVISGGCAIMVAVAGGMLTELGDWYHKLKQPSWKPPDWAFGPIWTVILTLAAVAGALGWQAAPDAGARGWMVGVFFLNCSLNVFWNMLFFTLRRPDWALAEVALLWLSILALIVMLGANSFLTGLLMVPYLIWVSAAAVLNFRVVQLNGPFKTHVR
jgi:translocator protein